MDCRVSENPEQNHIVTAIVDDIKIIVESNESNNSFSKELKVTKERIFDPEEDYDGDGLTNAQELMAGTDLNHPDTDGDLISDYDEITGTLGSVTDPLDPDTDCDGIYDYTEIKLGLNPLVADEKTMVTKEAHTMDHKVVVTVNGDQNLTVAPFKVIESDNVLWLPLME